MKHNTLKNSRRRIGLLFCCWLLTFSATAQSWAVLSAKADSCERKGEVEPAFSFQKMALQQAAVEFGPGHRNYGETLHQLGIILSLKSRGKAAEDTLLMARRVFQQVGTPADSLLGVNDEALALHYRRQNQFAKAEQVYQRALDHWANRFGKNHIRYSSTLLGLANLYQQQRQPATALPILLEAVANRRQAHDRDSREYGSIISSLGTLYSATEQYDKAEPLFLETLALRRSKAKDHPTTANTANNLAVLYEKMGDFEKALALHRDALRIREKQLPGSADHANTLQNIAVCLNRLGQKATADSLYGQALLIYAKSPGRRSISYANTLANRANLRNERVESAEALRMFREALATVEALNGTQNLLYARLLNNAAMPEQALNHFGRADSLLGAGLAIIDTLIGPATMEHAGYVANRAVGWYAMGLHQQAVTGMNEAIAIYNRSLLKNFLYFSPSQKEAYTARWSISHPVYYSMSLQQRSDTSLSRDAYTLSLFIKSLLLNEHSQLANTLKNSPNQLIARQLDSLQQLNKRIDEQYSLPPAKRGNLDSLEARAETMAKGLARQSAPFRAAQQAIRTTWRDVQKSLKAGEAAVEFVHFQYHNGTRLTDSTLYMALLLRPGWVAPKLIPLTHEKALARLLAAPAIGLTASLKPLRTRQQKLLNTGQLSQGELLYQLIWQPLDSLLRGVGQVWVAPSGLLHKVALAALPYPSHQGYVLADRYVIRQVNTTRTLATAAPTHWKTGSRARLYGGVTYGTDSTGRTDWSALPGTLREVQAIGQVLGSSATVVTGQQATKTHLIAQPAVHVVHLATHGFFQSPDSSRTDFVRSASERTLRRSGVVLAGANRPTEADNGILSGQELANLNLTGTDLVVLSGCDTGLGDIRGSEGVFGLQRAVKMAGAKNLLMSLWPVSDGPTSQFMAAFYTNWRAGKPLHKAFALTQRQFRKAYPPAVWASFVLVE